MPTRSTASRTIAAPHINTMPNASIRRPSTFRPGPCRLAETVVRTPQMWFSAARSITNTRVAAYTRNARLARVATPLAPGSRALSMT